ncbi:PREDICTED: uncharacterized protein LOC105450762 [Wasmannia auropunctata]|uniref:uncharacterized protein LOC105450762 n=1 Tax=Wasmannia auropunctata TaxID=64793 RepID=UPI0005ED7939|nr:PREDICTED: uncharacterized protein LOC105450762 [Wasmannia auropunctata]
MNNKLKSIEIARQMCLIDDNRKIVSDAAKENIDTNIVEQDFLKNRNIIKLSNNDAARKTRLRSISRETPCSSKDYCTEYNTSDDKSPVSMRNVSPSELYEMSPITSHMTAFMSTPCSSRRTDSVVSDITEVAFDIKAFEKKVYIFNQEISSKLDVIIMNQCRLNRYLLPHEKRIVRPADLPALPLTTQEELKKFEKYLSKDDNVGATAQF